ncbi:MAG: type 4b pilus protein PilO2 [Deltaproteobacteria bacterium]|jgi:hypothetical protein|nr:type 4b pilus protein PilO2 [Deltaproteobacteria bacterium]
MYTLRIGKHDYAIGIWWLVRPGGAASRKIMLNLARETSKKKEYLNEHFNYAVIRQHQYGLCYNPLPDKKLNAYSLAAAIRLTSSHKSFIGVFNLGTPGVDLWWMCGISKGIIAAQGDVCFTSKEEAEKAAHSLKQLFAGVEEVVCDTLEASLAYLTRLLHPENTLEPLFSSKEAQRKKQYILGILVLIAVASVGGVKIYDMLEEKRIAQERQSRKAAAEQRKLELQATVDSQFLKAWQTMPLPSDAGAQCAASILAQPLAVQGWTLKEAICSPSTSAGNLVVSLSHNRGAAFLDLPGLELVSAQEARATFKLPALPRRSPEEYKTLMARPDASAFLYDITQKLNANLEDLNWSKPEILQKEGLALVSPWQRGNFKLSNLPATAMLTPEFFRIFNQPGCCLNSMRYQANDQSWSIEGVIYALYE